MQRTLGQQHSQHAKALWWLAAVYFILDIVSDFSVGLVADAAGETDPQVLKLTEENPQCVRYDQDQSVRKPSGLLVFSVWRFSSDGSGFHPIGQLKCRHQIRMQSWLDILPVLMRQA